MADRWDVSRRQVCLSVSGGDARERGALHWGERSSEALLLGRTLERSKGRRIRGAQAQADGARSRPWSALRNFGNLERAPRLAGRALHRCSIHEYLGKVTLFENKVRVPSGGALRGLERGKPRQKVPFRQRQIVGRWAAPRVGSCNPPTKIVAIPKMGAGDLGG